MAGEFIWYELLTTDAAAAQRFYGEVVGWSFADPQGGGYIHIEAEPEEPMGGMVQLTAEMEQGGATPTWLGYVHVDDVDAEAAAWQQAGGKVQMPAMDIPNVGRIAMLADPHDAPLYVMKPTPPPDRPDAKSNAFSVTEPRHVRWNELAAPDATKALAFYGERFGWTAAGAMPMGEMGDYTFLAAGGTGIGAVVRGETGWRYYIGVDDIDRAVEAVNAGGGEVLEGPHEIPGGEFSLHGRDPQGATFGLVGPRKG
jgi:predicted enzyme related to lactoylglutathione lyase